MYSSHNVSTLDMVLSEQTPTAILLGGGGGGVDIKKYNGNQSAGKSQRCALKLMLNFKFALVVFCDSVIKAE